MDTQPLTDPIGTPPEVLPPPKPPLPRVWIVAGAVTVVCIIALMFIGNFLNAPKPSTVPVVEAPTPTPTPVRFLSSIATQSAFMALEQAHASLSANIAQTNLDDPSLSPPVLTLPLGFGQ